MYKPRKYDFTPRQIAKVRRGTCASSRCLKKVDGTAFCSMHSKRQYKSRHPLRYKFSYLKNNARRRGIDWELSFQDFARLASQNGYDRQCGKMGDSLSIDRIDNRRGYAHDNVQFITLSENSRKGCAEREGVPF